MGILEELNKNKNLDENKRIEEEWNKKWIENGMIIG